ncbi:hypothetical protein AB0G00_16585 [Nocardia salmonicida]|uniref:hypothetical protein n=1 Tax=Nocardia salmonicida TaxID=53431 RepID=UPI0033C0C0A2
MWHVVESDPLPRPPRPGELSALLVGRLQRRDRRSPWSRSRRTAHELSEAVGLRPAERERLHHHYRRELERRREVAEWLAGEFARRDALPAGWWPSTPAAPTEQHRVRTAFE